MQIGEKREMIEAKELVKVYKPKKGVPVTALNKISLKFPDKGMVFLLGKSGSGKSTLLNLLGGLDKADGGEIIVKGQSTKEFKQQHFDSYRNTYVGFIFQEYNILEEFSVGANIALAIELQGRKATDEEINEILKEVDLDGFGNRKPNELSGGQKQRVAIARALVKKPEIIMADEPTGALDSNTGKQVFDTLKKLSKDRLVIIVSHDREFSELYADRIIELADGNVISDVERSDEPMDYEENKNLKFEGDTVKVTVGYHLTEEDRIAINEYLDRITDETLNIRLTAEGSAVNQFVPTNQDNIKTKIEGTFELIKSKLPLKNAFKIGVSALGYKKIRLIITILLSCVAFGLFGLADTFGSYDMVKAGTQSLLDSKVDYISFQREKEIKFGNQSYYEPYGYISKEAKAEIEKELGTKFVGVYTPRDASFEIEQYDYDALKDSDTPNIYTTSFVGYAEVEQEVLDSLGYKVLEGKLPDGKNDEVAISEFMYEFFTVAKYTADINMTPESNPEGTDEIVDEEQKDADVIVKKPTYVKIEKYTDLIGKKLFVNGKEYTITAIIDTNANIDRYRPVFEKEEHISTAEEVARFILMAEFQNMIEYSLTATMMVGPGHIDEYVAAEPKTYTISDGYLDYETPYSEKKEPENYYYFEGWFGNLESAKGQEILWLNGERTTLKDNEIIITSDFLNGYNLSKEELKELIDTAYTDLATQKLTKWYSGWSDNSYVEEEGYKVVGVILINNKNTAWNRTVIIPDKDYKAYVDELPRMYTHIVGDMPDSKSGVEKVMKFTYEDKDGERCGLLNAVIYELELIDIILKTLSKVFLVIGIGFAIFAAVMLANFIGTSISYKKQEIGILRAIGARSNDVFRIFFSEAFVIAMINFVLSATFTGIVSFVINTAIREGIGILVTILNFGIRQVALIFAISVASAFVACFLPVKKIASKKPIDAIRKR